MHLESISLFIQQVTNGDDDDEEGGTQKKKGKGRKKPAYAGGLVLEPKKGLCF